METKFFFTPLQNYVVVKIELSDEAESGLIIPDELKKKYKQYYLRVISIGPDVHSIEVGDKVHVLNHEIPTISSLDVNEEDAGEYGIIREFDVVGKYN